MSLKGIAEKKPHIITGAFGVATLGLSILLAYLLPDVPGMPKPRTEVLYERRIDDEVYLIKRTGDKQNVLFIKDEAGNYIPRFCTEYERDVGGRVYCIVQTANNQREIFEIRDSKRIATTPDEGLLKQMSLVDF